MAKEVNCVQKCSYPGITFSEPDIAVIGKSYKSLMQDKTDFAIGKSGCEHQGRDIIMGQNEGRVRPWKAGREKHESTCSVI
jgi:dihydrolipoamide dehydrogenase